MLNGKQIVPVQTRSKTMLKIYTMQIKKKAHFHYHLGQLGELRVTL